MLVSSLRVAWACQDEPHGVSLIINEIPDAAAAADLKLPLLELAALEGHGS